jgi:hypothetical protein
MRGRGGQDAQIVLEFLIADLERVRRRRHFPREKHLRPL